MEDLLPFVTFKFFNDLHEACEKKHAVSVYIRISEDLNYYMPFKTTEDKTKFNSLLKLLKVTYEKGKESKSEEFRLKLGIEYPQLNGSTVKNA